MYVFLYATLSRSLYRPEEDRAWNSVEFQSAVNCSEWMLGTKARFSGTALKHWAFSPSRGLLFLGARRVCFYHLWGYQSDGGIIFKIYGSMLLKEWWWDLANIVFFSIALPLLSHAI